MEPTETQSEYHSQIEAYTVTGDIKAAEKAYIRMTMEGIQPTICTYTSMLTCYANAQDIKSCWDIIEQLNSKKMQITSQVINLILKAITGKGTENDFTRVLSIMKCNQYDTLTYNIFIDVCMKTHYKEIAWSVFESIISDKEKVKPDDITFNTMLKICSISKDVSNAERVYKIMKQKCTPNTITLNTLMDMYIRCGESECAWQLYDTMKEISPDSFTYSILLKDLINQKYGYEKFIKLVTELKDRKIAMDEILYNSVMDICVKFNQCEKAITYYNEMVLSDIMPTSITHGILIKAYGKMNQVDNAIKVFNKMKQPTIVTYGSLIDACVKNDQFSQAIELFEDMKSKCIEPNTIIYSIMIKGYSRIRDASKALLIFQEMMENATTMPNNITYNSIIDCCIKCRRLEKAVEIYNQMKMHKSPDLITYSIVIKGYCYARQLQSALVVLEEMISNNIMADEILYNSLLEGCYKCNEPAFALRIYASMASQNITPTNITYSILAKVYSLVQDVTKAMQLLDIMKKEKIKPTLITYTCLIKACMKCHQPSKAIEVYSHMREKHVIGDAITFTTLLEGLVAEQKYNEAADILVESLNNHIDIRKDIIDTIMKNSTLVEPTKKTIISSLLQKGPTSSNKTLIDISNIDKHSHYKKTENYGKENHKPMANEGKAYHKPQYHKIDRLV